MNKEIIPIQQVAQAIRFLRGERVLLDFDLAQLYGVTAGNLNKAVRRNCDRFPADFIFQLTAEETKSKGQGGRRHFPHAFTEQGVAMLSSVLNSELGCSGRRVACNAFPNRSRHGCLYS